MISQTELLVSGWALVENWCAANRLPAPELRIQTRAEFLFRDRTCAYYRPSYVAICPELCARPGTAGRAWSWPGYVVDRTPHGVVCHELGHHVDWLSGNVRGHYWSDYSATLRAKTKERPLTGYCDNDAEWFAEIFRLFVTNPDLLSRVRPKTAYELSQQFECPPRPEWDAVLAGAPARTLAAVRAKFQLQVLNV